MSWSLVKRGLELCEEEQQQQQQSSKSRKVEEGTKHKLTRCQREKIASKQRKIAADYKNNIKTIFTHKQPVRSVLEKYHQKAPRDRTTDNIKLLKKIDKKRTPQQYVDKILEQHNKQLDRRVPTQKQQEQGEKKGKKETSVFSDEDFEKMNKEWLKLY